VGRVELSKRCLMCDLLQHSPADVWVVKERELGSDDHQVHCRTHLGHLLTPGDVVLGSVQLVSLESLDVSVFCCCCCCCSVVVVAVVHCCCNCCVGLI